MGQSYYTVTHLTRCDANLPLAQIKDRPTARRRVRLLKESLPSPRLHELLLEISPSIILVFSSFIDFTWCSSHIVSVLNIIVFFFGGAIVVIGGVIIFFLGTFATIVIDRSVVDSDVITLGLSLVQYGCLKCLITKSIDRASILQCNSARSSVLRDYSFIDVFGDYWTPRSHMASFSTAEASHVSSSG